MKNWKWQIEDDYAGPAGAAWVWISAGIGVWGLILYVCFSKL